MLLGYAADVGCAHEAGLAGAGPLLLQLHEQGEPVHCDGVPQWRGLLFPAASHGSHQ